MVRSTLIGLLIGMAIFCIIGVSFDIRYGGTFEMRDYMFTKSLIGMIAVSLGFGMPAAIYYDDRIAMPIKIVIHMVIGYTVLMITALFCGWMAADAGAGEWISYIAGPAAGSIAIWLGFWRYNTKQAEKMNERIDEMNKDR